MIGDLENCQPMSDGYCSTHKQPEKDCRKKAVDEWDKNRLRLSRYEEALNRVAWEDGHRVHAVNPPCGHCPSCIAREALRESREERGT